MRKTALALVHRLSQTGRHTKRAIQVGVDTVILTGCFFLAMVLRLDDLRFASDPNVWWAFLISLPLTLAILVRLGFYRAMIRYITSRAVNTILIGSGLTAVVLFGVAQIFGFPIPRSVPLIYALLMLVSIGGLRFLVRALFQWEKTRTKASVIIYGAGESGRQLQMSLRMGPEYAPVAFVDDAPELQGREVGGMMVHSPGELGRLVADYGVEAVLLAIPSAPRAERAAILARLERLPVRVQTVPGIADIVSGRQKTTELRQVTVEDLLGRDPVRPLDDLMDRDIRGRVVLVTGAGGSIGSELCRQILARGPRMLLLFDVAEFSLYAIDQELRLRAGPQASATTVVPLLGSVCDETRVTSILTRFEVETIYHAAAYKHVPLVEENVVEGVENNLFGTLTLAEAAIAAGVATFIMISTDKAVRPTNVMGATKRMAELVCQALARRQGGTRFSMVRFGNVLGSSGSVIPLFKGQIERGGPITVTHPEITRYFMTIPEAAQLVIQAGAMGNGGEVFLLDMGDPVRILDLARRMARFSGLKARVAGSPSGPNEPASDIEIVFSGLRPGEKLYEELLVDECAVETAHPRIRAAEEIHLSWAELEPILTELRVACADLAVPDIRRILADAPIGYAAAERIADLVWSPSPR